ncbi:MAG: FHA domain-containing protein [Chloroflexi bacterium]|nr:FHA domain-containing protein [Chloroflexota bacterium]
MKKNLPTPLQFERVVGGMALFLTIVLGLSALVLPVSAQTANSVSVTGLDITSFPLVKFFLQVTNVEGKIVNDLQPDQLEIMEDGFVRPVTELTRIQTGSQIILAVNESPALTNQIQGVSYYRTFMQTLDSWAAALPQGLADNYSYVTNNGIQIDQVTDPGIFSQMLTAYEPDLLNSQPGLTSLTMALDMTTNPLPNAYSKRAILYITPLPDAASLESLPNISLRAAQLGTRVFIWLVAPGYSLEAPEITPLRELADQSGGEIFLFNGQEGFPNPESYFDPLRNIYQVSYKSAVTTSGEHTLVTRISRPDLQITGEQIKYTIQLAPPNPIFLDPPSQITRSLVAEDENNTLVPSEIPINILVEFPDGYPRELQTSRLFVNEVVTAENLSAPFDQFNLPLEVYEESSEIHLRVEVVDELGMSASSIDTLVQVIVEKPEPALITRIFTGRGLSVVIAVSMAAVVLGLVIYFTSQSSGKRVAKKRHPAKNDPLTQPVLMGTNRRKATRAVINSPTIRKPPEPSNVPARLVRLSEDGMPVPERVISIIRRETSLGSDPQTAICVLDNPSVSANHARIYQNSEGQFFVADAGSVAGTWVNYDPVNENGCKLVHCDIIHFGLMAFRFELSNPDCIRKPIISPCQTDKS